MSIIIRLQNLPWAANSVDIRRYFTGLSIPEGGVHIVGGEKGDAFIAFSTDEDARQAMERDGGKIKDMKVKLLLSSRTEMGRVIEQARNQTLSLQTPSAVKAAANDSDRRKIRDHSPSPNRSRKDAEKSPVRERRKTSYSKRDRSRSRSRSPPRRTDRDRDIDRRSDRGKRDDRSRYDERGDSRYKSTRDYNTRDSSPDNRKNENDSKVQSEPIRNKSFDPQMGATPQSFDSRHLDGGSLRTGSMEFNPRQGNLPDNSSNSSFLDSRSQSASGSATSSFTFPAALNMAHIKLETKPEPLPPVAFSSLDKFSSLFDNKQPVEGRTSGNYETKRPSPTPAALAPKVEPNLQYAKGYSMTSRADPYNSVSSNFGNCPDPTASTYSTVQTAEKGAVPAVPHDRKNVLPSKPVYGAEPHARYEQIPEANQASRSSTAPVPADDPRSFSKRSPVISSAVPATAMPSNVKPRRSRFEPEVPTLQGNVYSKAPTDPRSSSALYSSRSIDATVHTRQPDNPNPPSRESNLSRKDVSWHGQPSGATTLQRPALLTPPQHSDEFPEAIPMDVDNSDDKNITNMLSSNPGTGHPLRREIQSHDPRPQHSRTYFPNNPDHQKNSPFEEHAPPRPREPPSLNESSRRGPPLNQSEELPLRGRNGGPPLKRAPASLTVIVKNLPYDVTETDVLTLFRGIFVSPENLKLQRNNHSLPVAYVKFVKLLDYNEALSRSRQKSIANTFPEISPCTLLEFDNAHSMGENVGPSQTIRRPDLRPREEDLCVEIEGFPASCTEDDLIHFFDGLGILDIVIKENPDDRGTVLGYVEFATPADFHSALDSAGKMIGHRYITITTSSKEIMTSAQKNKRVRKEPSFPQSLSRDSAPPPTHRGPNKNPRPIPQDGPMYCVAINGLPEMVKNRDIADFFAENKIVPRAIHIMLDSKKLPSGEGFAEFISLHEFEIALQRNGKFLAGSRVSVGSITYQEMSDILKGPSSAPPLLRNPSEDRPTRRPLMPMPPPREEEEMAFRERRPLDDIPPDNFGLNRHRPDSRYSHNERSFDHPGPMGVRPPFSRMRSPVSSRLNNRPRPALFGSDGPPPRFGSEGPPPRFGSDGPPRFGSDGPPRFGSDGPPPRFGSDGPPRFGSSGPLPRFGSDGPPPRFRPTGPQRGPLLPPNDGPQDFGMPGCVVSINNLHFRAGLDEIMEAFHGFPLDKDKIIRKYNDKGQATGEARIAFQCHEDATRAVEEVNQKIIFGRPIYLSIV